MRVAPSCLAADLLALIPATHDRGTEWKARAIAASGKGRKPLANLPAAFRVLHGKFGQFGPQRKRDREEL